MAGPTWAIIPARGGSKGIPRKNIRPLGGVPLIGHAIRAAQASGVFDRILVSTEDAEIAEVARAYGAEVPYRRPIELAADSAPLDRVVFDLLDRTVGGGPEPTAYAVLSPTFPFRTREMILQTLELLAHFVMASTFQRVRYGADGWFLPGGAGFRRAAGTGPGSVTALRATGHVNAQRFFPADARTTADTARQLQIIKEWVRTGSLKLGDGSVAGQVVVEDPILSLDLDEPEDWLTAEWILREGWFVPEERVA